MLVQLEQDKEKLQAAGLQTIVIAQGEPKHVKRYCHTISPSVECLCREDTDAYYAYGMAQAGIKETLNPQVLVDGFNTLFRKKIKGGEIIGDPRMMPATFIINQQGVIMWTYYSSIISDNPSLEDILTGAKSANL